MKDISDWQSEFESCSYSEKLINKIVLLNTKANNPVDIPEVKKAIYYAKKYHADQKRHSGEPYYTHPIEVAYMVSDYLFKTDVIVASILHDIVEDTAMTAGMILDVFGRRVEEMVDRLTRNRPDGSKLRVEQILSNASAKNDSEVLIIKLVDRLHNMQTIEYMSPKKQMKTALDTISDVIGYAYDVDLVKSLTLIAAQYVLPEEVEELERLYSKKFSYYNYHLPFLKK